MEKPGEIGRLITRKKGAKKVITLVADFIDGKTVTIYDSSDNDWSDNEDVPVIATNHVPGDVESVGTESSSSEEGEEEGSDLENSTVSRQSTSSSRS